MHTIAWLLVLAGVFIGLSYKHVSLLSATAVAGLAFVLSLLPGAASWFVTVVLLIALAVLLPLNFDDFRRQRISKPILNMYRRMLPGMSETERVALEAGTVGWEGELFGGAPDWNKLKNTPAPRISDEEQAFIDGPLEELCTMLDRWQINYELGDLPAEVYEFIKKNRMLAMIIPKQYGGLEFSALAQSQVLVKIAMVNGVAGNFIAVPNSLGPAELLHKYGTDEQRDYYLPRLATGEEIPCFALTGPRAGSDATSIPDTGVVCKGKFEGKEIIGMRLNFDKRYITLAPIATLVGLAFKLHDPDHLIGDQDDYGITCALIPADTPGVTIGRRHFPIGAPFQNGPIQGEDVFVPLEYIIGGQKMAGQGWRMLVECLSVGRCITLPSNSLSGAKAALAATGAYARIRKQFNIPIGRMEGVQEALARIAGFVYIMDAGRTMAAGDIDRGEKPSVPSAILKYHLTEMARKITIDAMDVHGGKGAIKGPNNYLSWGYETMPVAITVEGANILTRSMIIFGQGAVRCHPYVLQEMHAAQDEDNERGLQSFDRALFAHVGLLYRNGARAFVLALTGADLLPVPFADPAKQYAQQLSRCSAAFAMAADGAMLTVGGKLKFRESLSGRLGDLLSYLYLGSAVLKHYEDQGRPAADWPVVEWACQHLLYAFQEQMHGFLQNLPNRLAAFKLRSLIFPLGRRIKGPSDSLTRQVAELMIRPSETRARLIAGMYDTPAPNNPIGRLNQLLNLAEEIAPLESKLVTAVRQDTVTAPVGIGQIDEAERLGVLTAEEAGQLRDYDGQVMEFINVDDFAPGEIGVKPPAKATRAKATKTRRKKRAESSEAAGEAA